MRSELLARVLDTHSSREQASLPRLPPTMRVGSVGLVLQNDPIRAIFKPQQYRQNYAWRFRSHFAHVWYELVDGSLASGGIPCA